jgi:hypothetical protein
MAECIYHAPTERLFDHLPWVMLGLRAAPREDSCLSAAVIVYVFPLALPGQFLSTTHSLLASTLLRGSKCGRQDGSHIAAASAIRVLRASLFVYF